jgi:hypothetical protein
MPALGKYILAEDGKTPVECDNEVLWAKWFQGTERHVARWHSADGKVTVSTVFLGLDHNFEGGEPVLWETLISGGEHDEFMDRYTSYEDALNGHEQAIMMVESAKGE